MAMIRLSTELQEKFSEIFEKEVIVYPTASGTAANALSIINNDTSHLVIFIVINYLILILMNVVLLNFIRVVENLIPLTGINGKITA